MNELHHNHASGIADAYAELCRAGMAALDKANELGRKVKAAKEDVEAEKWDEWCGDYLPFDSRFANRSVAVHEKCEQLALDFGGDTLEIGSAMKLLGTTPQEEGRAVAGAELKWAKYVQPLNRLYQWAADRKRQAPVDQWPDFYKRSIRDKLRPAVELYEELSREDA